MISFLSLLGLSTLTFLFTTILAIAGVGAAFIIIPTAYYYGIDFLTATALGLLSNTFSTGTASIRHHRNNVIDYNMALPIVFASIVFTPIGAFLSDSIPRMWLRFLFALFLVLVGTNILVKTYKMYKNEKENENNDNKDESEDVKVEIPKMKRILISLIVGTVVGLLAGLIGVGGGSLILPFLLYFGMDTKKAAGTTSFIVVFSSLLGFISKVSLATVNLDIGLVTAISVSTIFGAILGSYLMHYKLNKHQIKAVMGVMLILVSVKIFLDLL